MRFLLIICFVILCMAITIRVDGVWPPAAIDQQVVQAVRQVAEPGKALRLLLNELLPAGADRRHLTATPAAPVMIHAMLEGRQSKGQPELECG